MKDIKGLHVKKLSMFLIVLETILIILSIVSIVNVYSNYRKVEIITDDYIEIQKNIYNIQLDIMKRILVTNPEKRLLISSILFSPLKYNFI